MIFREGCGLAELREHEAGPAMSLCSGQVNIRYDEMFPVCILQVANILPIILRSRCACQEGIIIYIKTDYIGISPHMSSSQPISGRFPSCSVQTLSQNCSPDSLTGDQIPGSIHFSPSHIPLSSGALRSSPQQPYNPANIYQPLQ